MRKIQTRYHAPYKEYWVIFTQGVHWISYLLRPNFSHIYLLTRDEHNWLMLNPTRLYLQAEILPFHHDQDVPRLMAAEHDTIVKITFGERDSVIRYGTIGLLNCVTWSKYMLGLNVRGLTPYQFYKTLINFNQNQLNACGIQSIKRI